MKTYQIYIKSHTIAPDFEAEVEAENTEEAARKFSLMSQLTEWRAQDLEQFIVEKEPIFLIIG